MSQINGLIRYINGLQKELNVSVIIKDFIGFLSLDHDMFTKLQKFYIHQSPYCMNIKGDEGSWDKCLLAKDKIENRLKGNPKAFYGHCYAGVGEYVLPIMAVNGDKSVVVGALTIGGFYNNTEGSLEVYKDEIQSELYNESFVENSLHLVEIEEKGQVITEYLSLLYADEIRLCLQNKDKEESNYSYIIGHAMAYMKVHYKEDIKLSYIASFCHCSPSLISHQFKPLVGRTIKTYINELRVKEAKKLLTREKLSITETAYMIGFKDSNYFSKVFKDIEGRSPLAYRKQVDYVYEKR